MITQEDIFGVNIGAPWAPGEVEEEVLKGNEKGFITSPADIDPREPIKLRDAEVTPKHRKAFQDLCSEFNNNNNNNNIFIFFRQGTRQLHGYLSTTFAVPLLLRNINNVTLFILISGRKRDTREAE